jgi:hypothetical protein
MTLKLPKEPPSTAHYEHNEGGCLDRFAFAELGDVSNGFGTCAT